MFLESNEINKINIFIFRSCLAGGGVVLKLTLYPENRGFQQIVDSF